MKKLKRMWNYISHYGLKLFILKLVRHDKRIASDYEKYVKEHIISNERWKEQRLEMKVDSPIKISIVVPAYETKERFLRDMIQSVLEQSYENWELCIADGSHTSTVENVVTEYMEKDKRIKFKKLSENLGISENTNTAMEMATGEFVGLLDHDDFLSRDAIYEMAKRILADSKIDVLYSDEDKITFDGVKYFEPHFKSDYNLELLRSNNYICHFFVARRRLIEEIGGFRREFDGAQDYDFIFRCVEKARKVEHIPKVLYHWRTHIESTAENPESKLYAYQSGKKVIEEHLRRVGEDGDVNNSVHFGFYHVSYRSKIRAHITVVIVGEAKQAKKCANRVKKTACYDNYNIIIVSNLSELSREKCLGEFLVLLDSHIQICSNCWMNEMLGCIQRNEIGVVGTKIYSKDERVMHAGMILGMKGYAFQGMSRTEYGYFHRDSIQQNLSAVTMLFIMIRTELYFEIQEDNGEVEDEIQFCNCVRNKKYQIVYNPKVESYFIGNTQRIKRQHNVQLECDPYYNPNLSLENTCFY